MKPTKATPSAQPTGDRFLAGLNKAQRLQRIVELLNRDPPLTLAEHNALLQEVQAGTLEKTMVLLKIGLDIDAQCREDRQRAEIDRDTPRDEDAPSFWEWVAALAPWLSCRVTLTLSEFAWLAVQGDARYAIPRGWLASATQLAHYDQTLDLLRRYCEKGLTPLPMNDRDQDPRFDVGELVDIALTGGIGEMARSNIGALVNACPRHSAT